MGLQPKLDNSAAQGLSGWPGEERSRKGAAAAAAWGKNCVRVRLWLARHADGLGCTRTNLKINVGELIISHQAPEAYPFKVGQRDDLFVHWE
jgi:hypothetical protein